MRTMRCGSGSGWPGERLQRQAEYWQAALAGAPAVLELPTDHARPARAELCRGSVPVVLDAALTAGLEASGQPGTGRRLFMTLLAGWAALLGRLVGPGRSGDRHARGEPQPGRDRGADRVFRQHAGAADWMFRARRAWRAAGAGEAAGAGGAEHQDIPFEQVVEIAAAAAQSGAQSGVPGDVCLAEHSGEGSWSCRGWSSSLWAAALSTAKFDLTLSLGEVDGAIVGGSWSTPRRCSSRATMERYIGILGGDAGGDGGGRSRRRWIACRC